MPQSDTTDYVQPLVGADPGHTAGLPDLSQTLEQVQTLANLGVWRWDGHELIGSSTFYKIHGYVPRPLNFGRYLRWVHPDDRRRLGRLILDLLGHNGLGPGNGSFANGKSSDRTALGGHSPAASLNFEINYRIVQGDGRVICMALRGVRELITDRLGIRSVQLSGIVQDVSDRQQVIESSQRRDERLRQQNEVLIQLARSRAKPLVSVTEALAEITQVVSKTLQVHRVSVWLYDDERQHIHCQVLYDKVQGYSSGQVVHVDTAPGYFRALEQEDRIAVPNVLTDPHSWELAENYFIPLGITSVLDTPIYRDDQVAGVFCLEEIGECRSWTLEDYGFTRAIAEQVSFVFAAQNRQQFQQTLSESEQRFRLLFELSPDANFLLDRRQFFSCNAAAVEMFRSPSKVDLLAASPLDISADYQLDEKLNRQPSRMHLDSLITKTLKEGSCRVEWLMKRYTGELFETDLLLTAIELNNIRVIHCVVRDISDRKRAAIERHQATLALQDSRNILEAVFDGASDALFIVDPDSHRVVDCNQRAIELFEADNKAALIGMHCQDFYPKMDAPLVDSMNSELTNNDRQYITRKGRLFWGELAAKMIELAAHSITLIRVADISDRKQVEADLKLAKEKAESATRAKSEFLATMSHEIRTPMNVIVGIIELLRSTTVSAEQQDLLKNLKTSSEVLLSLINNILDFSRIESGAIVLEAEPFDLPQFIAETIALCEPLATEKSIHLESILEPNITRFWIGDITCLRQVLVNLLGNAIKFTQVGSVRLSVVSQSNEQDEESAGDRLIFTVQDTGLGMTAVQLENLFVPFHQGDNSITRRYGGTGLGLVISKRLCRLMGGDIEVVSQFGQGATFTATIEARRAQDQSVSSTVALSSIVESSDRLQIPNQVTKPGSESDPLDSSDISILVAEDNLMNQKVIRLLLSHLGYSATIVANGRLAIEAFTQSAFDLVLMDIQMPELDGLSATRLIRESFSDRPWIVGLSANAFQEDRNRAIVAGMDDYLTKPFKREQIIQILEHCRSRRRLADRNRVSAPIESGSVAVTPVNIDLAKAGHSVVDFTELQTSLDANSVRDIMLLYLSSSEDSFNSLRRALTQVDYQAIIAESHRIRGTSAIFGAQSLWHICEKLESTCFAMLAKSSESIVAQPSSYWDEQLVAIEKAYGDVIQAIQKEVDRL